MSDKERLEEIKSRVWKEKDTYTMGDSESREGYSYTLSDYDFEWLIQQAERVGELEKKKSEWKDTAQSYYMTNQELREQNKRYKQALEFYVDEENWISTLTSIGDFPCEVEKDQGEIARKALEGDNLKSERMKCLYCEEEIKD